MDAVQKANAGHPGTAMALAPLAYTLFKRFLRVNPQRPRVARPRPLRAQRRPRVRAAVLAAAPLRLRPGARRPRSSSASGARARPGTPSAATRRASRSRPARSGQGFANAVGMAMAERFLAERFNRPGHEIVDHHTYAICSDGDMMEGDQPGGRVDRRPLRARQADRLLRRQPHHDRRHAPRSPSTARTTPARFAGRRLARAAGRGLRGRRRARGARSQARARRNRAPVVHRDPLAHRLPRAERGRHRQGARRARSARTRCARPRR